MLTFVVLSTGSTCGAVTIQASNAEDAAKLYAENCSLDLDMVYVWQKHDYHTEEAYRPAPIEFELKQLFTTTQTVAV